jgi:hypothetical protein
MSVSMAEPGLDALSVEALRLAEAALDAEATRGIPDATVQRLMLAGLRLFARKVEEERRNFLPIPSADAATPTEIAVAVTELIGAVNLNLFDLSMWASRPRYDQE